MTNPSTFLRRSLAWTALAGALLTASVGHAESTSGTSQSVTWNCTGSNCPWGSPLSNPALVWPTAASASSARFDYTTTQPVYLPANRANGATIWVDSGSASAYAGQPGGSSHRLLATLSVGGFYTVSGLAAGEVLSVQSDSDFNYQIDLPEPTPPQDPPEEPQDPEDPPPVPGTVSKLVTWNCTGTPCPWGSSLTGQALAWPATALATTTRFGYTTSDPVYLPAARSNGATIWVDTGSATAYAGTPGASSHRVLASIAAGQLYTVSGLAAGEMLSVQADSGFTYQIDLPTPPEEPPPTTPTGTPSDLVTWTCTNSGCPWGTEPFTGYALTWPAGTDASSNRIGYTTSKAIYLGANRANGTKVSIDSGTASLYAGFPGAQSHRLITTLSASQTFTVSGIASGEVLSVQSDSAFYFHVEVSNYTDPPSNGNTVNSVFARWVCNLEDCHDQDWYSAVINWPSWAAYQTNNRTGENSRSVFSTETGTPLYPYMGSWANGCKVTATSGTVLIIEWQRGTNVWRETWLNPGDTHTIHLTAPEDGAMIEAEDYSPGFSVQLENCTPQPLP
jgi:hypothetical protein